MELGVTVPWIPGLGGKTYQNAFRVNIGQFLKAHGEKVPLPGLRKVRRGRGRVHGGSAHRQKPCVHAVGCWAMPLLSP